MLYRIFSKFALFAFVVLHGLNIQAATVTSGCTVDSVPVYDWDGSFLGNDIQSYYCHQTTSYTLQGSGTVWADVPDNGTKVVVGTFGVNATLEVVNWTNEDWVFTEFWAGQTINLDATPTGPVMPPLAAETYSYIGSTSTQYMTNMFLDPMGPSTSYRLEEYTNNNSMQNLMVVGETLWDFTVFAATLDGDGDGYSGVNVAAFGSYPYAMFTIDYQLSEVSPIPVPAAIWLFGSGLIGLAGISIRRKK